MFNKKSRSRRKHFLIDSNQRRKSQSKKTRNRTLNFFAKFLLIRHVFKVFRASFLVSFVLLLMVGFIAFALFSPYFEIKQIDINRETAGINVEAVQELLEPLYGTNLIFLDAKELKAILFANFLDFRSIEITEEWPDRLTIAVKLSSPAFTVFDMETANFATISADGVILTKKPDENLPVIKVKGLTKPFLPGAKFIDTAWLDKINTAQAGFTAQIKLTIKDIILLPLAQEVHFVSTGDTAFWFDLRTDIDRQLRKLEIGANKIGLYSKDLEHVDLRIPNQLFWK